MKRILGYAALWWVGVIVIGVSLGFLAIWLDAKEVLGVGSLVWLPIDFAVCVIWTFWCIQRERKKPHA